MRIKKSYLKNYKPQFVWTHNNVTLKLYIEPRYCITVIKGKEEQTYPLTFTEYCRLSEEAAKAQQPDPELNLRLFKEMTAKAKEYPDLEQFYMSAAAHYYYLYIKGLR